MPTLPVDIVNRALDECGIEAIGDLDDGSKEARAAQRIYWPTLRQMLSAALWNFARKQQQLVLLADRSGQLSAFGDVPSPWGYMYDWPDNCVHARFVPAGPPATATSGVPIFPTQTAISIQRSNIPIPFLVTSANRPNQITSNWYDVEGHDPEQTKVILTNHSNAQLIFTGMMQYPDAWDALFEQAMVAALAARLAMPLINDKKFAIAVRRDNVGIARAALDTARVRDGDEGWTVNDHLPDWLAARVGGGGWAYDGPGVLGYGWTSVAWLEAGQAY